MKIKARHVKMARAAFRCYLDRWPWDNWYPQSIIRWHRAAKGKRQ